MQSSPKLHRLRLEPAPPSSHSLSLRYTQPLEQSAGGGGGYAVQKRSLDASHAQARGEGNGVTSEGPRPSCVRLLRSQARATAISVPTAAGHGVQDKSSGRFDAFGAERAKRKPGDKSPPFEQTHPP
jgi:hypothetical protein